MRCLLVLLCVLLPRLTLADETDAQRRARQDRVAERRAGVAIICHRGALEFAHENTLEAFRAALELGADGNEIDIRATRDGVLICFHDDMLDMILDAFGDVSDYNWDELRTFRFRHPGPFGDQCAIPTLREVFELHQRLAGLLHLDIKRPGLDNAIAELLTQYDLWDHVMAVNDNGAAIKTDARYRPLTYKASLYLDRSEIDPAALPSRLARPGQAVIVEDPRGVLVQLKRPIGRTSVQPVQRRELTPRQASDESNLSDADLLARIRDAADWDQISESDGERAAAGARITARARAIAELSRRGALSAEARAVLVQRVRQRSLHRDWQFHGLDGATALRALLMHRTPEALELARESLWRDDEVLASLRNPAYDVPRSWHDFRLKMLVFRELTAWRGSSEAARLCRDYLALDEQEARRLGPLQFEPAATALLAVDLAAETLGELLTHSRSEVRGRAALYCLAHMPTAAVREALEAFPDWQAFLAAADRVEPPLVTRQIAKFENGHATATWYGGPAREQLDLLVHFHGEASRASQSFVASGVDGVLLVVNYRGLSSAYQQPFRQSPELFEELLDNCMQELRAAGQADAKTRWNRICLSSFSAGYGAVRELLTSPERLDRIEGLLAADSIYAGLMSGTAERQVDTAQMRDFLQFARHAVEGQKHFTITHCQLETPYASTRETADYLLRELNLPRSDVVPDAIAVPPRLLTRASRGRFTVLGYEGTEGEDHLWHLRNIHRWWSELPLAKRP